MEIIKIIQQGNKYMAYFLDTKELIQTPYNVNIPIATVAKKIQALPANSQCRVVFDN